ncbi:MAG TPA: hypothetical protein DIT13_03030 [Verrucomicrobiales bacterium]|nr:hypothetical protein [Verrucomicrobiales bacterium]HRJ07572.1 PQQ-like beta-propeller repeat protein [Prosthecobacter sp.]HRK16050.1 PQQ-like beta-propeller repeat protein [Prosthecobacter sp.]
MDRFQILNPAASLRWAVVAALLSFPAEAWSDDWPQFRGLKRDNVWRETGLLNSIPPEGLKIRWRQPSGPGWSSPAVAEGRVFLTDAELAKPDARERVRCFDAVTGEVLWSYAYDVAYPEWAFVPGQGGGPTPTPVVEAGRVFTVGANSRVHCLDAATGAVFWDYDPRQKYQVRDMQCRGSPLIDGDRLIAFIETKPGACVIALDKKSGKEIWRAVDERVSNSSPLIVEAGGERQLIVWTDDSVTSLDPVTGEPWWREPMTTSNNDSVPTPVFDKNRLLISGVMFELSTSEPTATMLWPGKDVAAPKRLLTNTGSPCLRGDHIYSAKLNGELVCLAAKTGEIIWRDTTITSRKGGAAIHLIPIDDASAFFLFTDQGNLIRAQLTPKGYQELGRALLIKPTTPFAGRDCAWAPPAFANRHVFVRNDNEILCASLAAEETAPRQ